MCFQPTSAPSCCAPMEREPDSVTSGYKHLAPLGRNPTASTRCTSKIEFAQRKCGRQYIKGAAPVIQGPLLAIGLTFVLEGKLHTQLNLARVTG